MRLLFHLAFTYIASLVSYVFLIHFYRKFTTLKLDNQAFILKTTRLSKIELRTVMVSAIPAELRDEAGLRSYFDELDVGPVELVVLCRIFDELEVALRTRAKWLMKMEMLYCKYTKLQKERVGLQDGPSEIDLLDGGDIENETPLQANDTDASITMLTRLADQITPEKRIKHRVRLLGPTVDAAEYFCQRFSHYSYQVDILRGNHSSCTPTTIAFVTFVSPETALIVSQINVSSKPFTLMTRAAPEPRDLFWPNISSAASQPFIKLLRGISVYTVLFFIVFFNTVIVSAISSLVNLDSLARLIPGIDVFVKALSPIARQVIQGAIPVTVLALWTSLLPVLLFYLSQLQGFESLSRIERATLSKYALTNSCYDRFFFYQVWNILLIVISSTLFKSFSLLNLRPQDIIELLGNSLPQQSPTLINYVLLQALAVYPLTLLQLGPLVVTYTLRIISNVTPRQKATSHSQSALSSLNYGVEYSIPLLLFVIGLVYAPIAPLIIPITALFFAIAYTVMKYILLYIHVPIYANGEHAGMVVRRCIVGVGVMQITMMGVLAIKSVPVVGQKDAFGAFGGLGFSGYVTMVLAVMPLLFMTFGLYIWFKQGYERQVRNMPMDLVSRVARELEKEEELSSESLTKTPIDEQAIDCVPDQQDESNAVTETFLLEPQMSKVEGVLDASDGDLLHCTYLHPALIGKLPIAWFEGCVDEFANARRIQNAKQAEIYNAIAESQSRERERELRSDILQEPRPVNRIRGTFNSFSTWASTQLS